MKKLSNLKSEINSISKDINKTKKKIPKTNENRIHIKNKLNFMEDVHKKLVNLFIKPITKNTKRGNENSLFFRNMINKKSKKK